MKILSTIVILALVLGLGILAPVVAAGEVSVSLNAPDEVTEDVDFAVTVDIGEVVDLNAVQYDISFNTSVLRLDDITAGQIDSTAFLAMFNEISPGTFRVVQSMGLGTVSGSGYLSVLHFHVIGSAGESSTITLSNGILMDINEVEIQATWIGDSVHVYEVDTTPPTVEATVPENLATGVAIATQIQVTFSEAMNTSSAEGAFSISPTVSGSFSLWGTENIVMTFTPGANMATDTVYTVTITTAAMDLAENHLATDYVWSFTTEKEIPTVTTDSASGVTTDSATLNMTYDFKDYASGSVRFAYRESGGDWEYTSWVAKSGSGSYSETITELSSDTTYDFKAQLEYNTTQIEGGVLQFTTGKVIPVITTNSATDITNDSATLLGNLDSLGDYTPVNVSFEWGTTSSALDQWTTPEAMTTTDTFSAALSGLLSNTTYYFRAKATGSVTVYGAELSFTTKAVPQVTTNAASDITTDSATLHGNLDSLGDYTPVNVSFEWGTESGVYTQETTPAETMTTTGAFSADLSGSLSSNTPYYFRAKATSDGITVYGDEATFITAKVPPAVTTSPASDITDVSATLNGNLTSLGNYTTVYVSFVWGTESKADPEADPYPNETVAVPTTMTEPGAFSAELGIGPGVTYYFRAKVTADGVTVYGDELSFGAPAVTTMPASDITNTTATLNGRLDSLGSYTSIDVSLVWGTESKPDPEADPYPYETTPETLMEASLFSAGIDTLTPGTTYYFRAKGVADSITLYGDEVSFTIPVVTTNPATNVTTDSATLHGSLDNIGDYASLNVSFVYGTESGVYLYETTPQAMMTTGAFSAVLDGILQPGTPYFFRAKAANENVTVYGDELSFTTEIPPVVTTNEASDITNDSATLNGTLVGLGSYDPVYVSFEWGETQGGPYIETELVAMSLTGTFSAELTGLSTGTTYYFRAKAITDDGTTVYGDELSFEIPGVTTNEATDLTSSSAILHGNLDSLGHYTTLNVSFVYGTESGVYLYETTPETMGAEGPFSAVIDGLLANTTYHFRAKATGSVTVYGDELSFTTETVVATLSNLPSPVTNSTSTDITIGGDWVTQYKYSLDGAAYGDPTDVSQHIALISLADGWHTLSVIGGDIAHNWQPTEQATTYSWQVDTVLPVVEGLADDNIPTKSKTWNWFCHEAATYRFAIDQNEGGAPSGEYSSVTTATKGPGAGIDGIWYIHVQAQDRAGNESVVYTVYATLDNIPPTATLSNIPPDPTNATTADITVGGEDVVYYKYKLDDSSYSGKTPVTTHIILGGLTEGEHTLYVIGQDVAGNWQTKELIESPTTATWTVDTTAPLVTITSPVDIIINEPSQTVTATIDDVAITEASLTLNGTPQTIAVTAGSFSQAITLVEGVNTISVSAGDAAGNTGSSSEITVTLDTTPPTATLINAPAGIVNYTTADITVDGEGVVQYKYKLDTGSYGDPTDISEHIVLSELSEGEHTLYVLGKDAIGNWQSEASPTTTTWTVDTEAPLVTITSPQDGLVTNNASQTVTGTIDDVAIAEASLTLNGTPQTIAVAAGSFSQAITLVEGVNTISVSATDAAEYTGSSGTITVTLDTVAPVVTITSPADGLITNNASQTVTGTIDDPTITEASLTLNGTPQTIAVTAGSFSQAITLVEGDNTISVSASDAAGNTGTAEITVTLDTAVPSLTSPANGTSTTVNTPTFEWDEVTGADKYHIQIASDTDFSENLQENDNLLANTYIAAALADGTWYWHVKWMDTTGSWSSYSATWAFTISTQVPTVSITSPNDGATFTTPSQTVVGTVTAAADITSATLTLNGVSRTIPVTNGNFSETVTLIKGSNTIRVSASNVVGIGTSDTITVTYITIPVVEITSPADDSIFATPVQTVTLTVDGLDIARTILNLNGIDQVPDVVLDEVGNFTYPVTLAEGENNIYVRATNDAGTGISSGITVTLDTDAPVVTITSPQDGLVTNNASQTVTGTIDDLTITEATLILNGVSQEPAVTVTSGDFTDYPITLVEGENTIEVTAADALSNKGSSGAITVILDTRPPIISITSPTNDSITNNTSQTITGTIDDLAITEATLTLNETPQTIAVTAGSFSQSITLRTDPPTNTIVVSATDAAGNTGSTSIVIIYDAVKPVVTIASPSSGQITGNALLTVTGTVSVSDLTISSATLILNGEALAIGVSAGKFGQDITLSPGVNTIEVTATDAAENTGSSGILTITLDTTAPKVAITNPRDGSLLGAPSIAVTGTIDDLSITSATLTLNGEDSDIEVSLGIFSQDVTLNAGSNTILVSASDAYGNRGTSGTLVVEVDVEKPVVTITTPSSGLVTSSDSLAVSGTIDDPDIDSVTLIVNGDSQTVTVSALKFGATVDLEERVNAIVVTATDNADPPNTGTSGVINVTLDTSAPTISLTSPASGLVVNTDAVTVAGTVDDPQVTNVTITVDGGTPQIIPVQAGSFSRTVSLLVDGDYTISISATDGVGNASSPITRTVTRNTAKPMVSIVFPANGYRTNNASLTVSATVTHIRDIESVTLSLNGGAPELMEPVDETYVKTVTLSSGDNTIEVVATDDIGNEGSSGVIHVTLDTTDPTLTIGLSDPTDSILITIVSPNEALQSLPAVSISGTTAGGVNITADIDMTLVGVNTWTGTYPETGILAEGSYTVSISGTDLAGNETTETATFGKETVTIAGGETETVETDTTTLEIVTTSDVEDASVSVTQHLENPAENVESELEAGVFVEIVVSAELRDSIESIYIQVNYDEADIIAQGIDESTLKLYLWNVTIGQWEEVPNSSVNTVENYIYGTVTHLSKYGGFGTAIRPPVVEIPYVAPPPPGTTDVTDVISPEGKFTEEAVAVSDDEVCELAIAADTIGLKADDTPLDEITMVKMEEPPAPPEDFSVIGLVYDFGPDKATFDPPITLTVTYDPTLIPEGVLEENLVIAMWDADTGEWVVLEGCSVDPVTHTITAPVSHFTAFAVLVYTRPAAFTTSALTITPAEVDIGETVIISLSVTNTGDLAGSYRVTLKIENVVIATKDVTLAGGATRRVTFTTSKDIAGTYAVRVDGRSGTFTVKTAPPVPPMPPVPTAAAFATSALSISPTEVEIGESVAINVLIANTGDLAGSYEVTLKVDNVIIATKDVTLAGGASQKVTFTTSKDIGGTYTVSVNGLSGTFTVKPVEAVIPVPAKAINWPVLGGVIGGVIVLGLLVLWLVVFRRRT